MIIYGRNQFEYKVPQIGDRFWLVLLHEAKECVNRMGNLSINNAEMQICLSGRPAKIDPLTLSLELGPHACP